MWLSPEEVLLANALWITERANPFFLQQRRRGHGKGGGLTGLLVGTLDVVLDSSARIAPYRILHQTQDSQIYWAVACVTLIVQWLDVTQLEKNATLLFPECIKVSTKDSELYFSMFLNISETFKLMEQLANIAMRQLFDNKSFTEDMLLPKPSKPLKNISALKRDLDARAKNEWYRATFRLPKDERLDGHTDCTLWTPFNKIHILGQMFVSNNYICFASKAEEACHLIIPLREAKETMKEESWNIHFFEYGRGMCMYRTAKTRELVQKGIPESLRGELWLLFSGALVDQGIFEELTRDCLPQLSEKMQDLGVISSISLSWFLTLFLSVMPFESAVVIVDCFFYEGIKVILQVSLAILDANMDKLLNCCDEGEAMTVLGRYLDNVVNRQSIFPPIPHLHALLTSGDDPPVEIDIFELIRTAYEAKHLMNCYWGNHTSATQRDQSLPYLEQYRINLEQFKDLFASLTPWSCGLHTPVLAERMFRLLDENKDSLINFKEFATGMSGMYHGDLTEKLKLLYKLHLPPERGTSPHDYRYHLRMWAKEKDARKETIKDLPKMSQVKKSKKWNCKICDEKQSILRDMRHLAMVNVKSLHEVKKLNLES
ncbi:TBC1 domain family member 9B isoform b [Crotalus adamanteus]|uniref:TBC1 domain family member 9B isoform b n=1 Tax=Crotalus adamanteus TaxID=8729 RepID=A0AAW1BWF3_CROAD